MPTTRTKPAPVDTVLIPRPGYHYAADFAANRTRKLLSQGELSDDEVYEQVMAIMASGIVEGPWASRSETDKETVIAVSQRTIRATIAEFRFRPRWPPAWLREEK